MSLGSMRTGPWIQFDPSAGSGLPERVSARRADFSKSSPCRTAIFTANTEFSNVLLLEIGRGCGRGCRFCAAGFVYRPVRYHGAAGTAAGRRPAGLGDKQDRPGKRGRIRSSGNSRLVLDAARPGRLAFFFFAAGR